MTSSPLCTVNATATTSGIDATASSTVTIALADTSGVTTWSLRVASTDSSTTAAALNALLSVNQTTKTATLAMPSSACAVIFESKVNNGRNTNGVLDDALTTRFEVHVLTDAGFRLIAADESTESDSSFGWTTKLNDLIESAGATAGVEGPTPSTIAKRTSAGALRAKSYTLETDIDADRTITALQADVATVDSLLIKTTQLSVGAAGSGLNQLRTVFGSDDDTISITALQSDGVTQDPISLNGEGIELISEGSIYLRGTDSRIIDASNTYAYTDTPGAAWTSSYANNVTSVIESIAQASSGAGGQRYIEPGLGASGSANGKLHLGLRNGNTVTGGQVNIGLGSTVAGVSDKLTIGTGTPGSLTDILRIYSPAASYTRIGESSGSAANLQIFCNATMDLTAGTTLSLNGPTSVTQRSALHTYADSSTNFPLTYTPASAATWTFGASIASVSISHLQDASAAGGNFTIRAQRGFAGFAGGDLILGAGDGGTTGTNAPGNTRIKVGTAVSNVSGIFRVEDEAGTSILDVWQSSASLSRISAGSRALRIGNLTETEVYIGGSGVTTITANANVVFLGGTGVTMGSPALTWLGVIAVPKITQGVSTGAGVAFTIEAQQGASGNAGGNLTLLSGKGGTPGTNSAGKIVLDVGAVVSGSSSAIQKQADTTVYTSEVFGTATTITSATTTNVVTFATTSNRVYVVELSLSASNDTDNEGAMYVRRAAFKNVAGTVTQIGTTTSTDTFEDAGQTGMDAVLDFSGTTIRGRLTTDATDTVNANGVLKIYERVLA